MPLRDKLLGSSHNKKPSKQVAIHDPAAQEAAAQSPNNSGSASPRASQLYSPNQSGEEVRSNQQHHAYSHNTRQDQQQSYPSQNLIEDLDPRQYPNSDNPPPARSQSTRYSASSAYHQQQQQQLLHHNQASSSVDNLAYEPRIDPRNDPRSEPRIDSRREHAQPPPQPQPTPVTITTERSKKSSIFGAFSRNKESKSNPPQTQHSSSGLGRKLSSRRSDNPPTTRAPQSATNPDQQRFDYQSAQGSRTHLAPQHEDLEDDVDPYQIRPGQEDINTAPPSAVSGHNQFDTIRPVQNDSSSDYDDRQLPVPPPHAQHPQDLQHQHSDSSSLNNHQYTQQNLSRSQQNLQPTAILTSDPYRQPNAETVSQLSYDSPTADQREEQQRVYANGHSPTSYPLPRQDFADRASSQQAPRPSSQSNSANMPNQPDRRQSRQPGPPVNQGQAESRDARDGPPPNYSRQTFPANQGQQPPTPGLPPNPPTNAANYRGGPPQRESSQVAGGGDQGRNTPPPVGSGERTVEDNYKELLVKYKKVKGLYFDKTAQVEQLQNTLAIQRLSQSRTSLDDSQYMNKFEWLDRAIVNLAFNIRKEWKTIPSWLLASCNQEAVKTGKQEMTGVGRAYITRFLVDEIFNKTFHPALDPQLSYNLKAIERNIRRNAAPTNNVEESEGLTAKIVNWRLATLEGLRDQLSSPQADENKNNFVQMAETRLCASLMQHLQDKVPEGLGDEVRGVIELAVTLATNMPLESRDIVITHPMPGDMVSLAIMKPAETAIPPLENPCEDAPEEGSVAGEKDEKDGEKSVTDGGKLKKRDPKAAAKKSVVEGSSSDGKKKITQGDERVRFAGFVAVEVRGKHILVKAPVWTMS